MQENIKVEDAVAAARFLYSRVRDEELELNARSRWPWLNNSTFTDQAAREYVLRCYSIIENTVFGTPGKCRDLKITMDNLGERHAELLARVRQWVDEGGR